MALMVLSIFSGVALADPIVGGGDAGNTASQASQIDPSVLLNEWTVYNGYLYNGDTDWYLLNTQAGEYLDYDLDVSVIGTVRQQIYDSSGSTLLGPNDYGSTWNRVSGQIKSKDYVLPGKGPTANYPFALKRRV